MIQTNPNSLYEDFLWILRILHSSTNNEHLNCSLKCFDLWERKYFNKHLTPSEKKTFNHMKNVFWVSLKKKTQTHGILVCDV
jgi:hypothetical protein